LDDAKTLQTPYHHNGHVIKQN